MAPKKVGKKKDEVVDLPKASTLPDGNKEYFIGGWSHYETLEAISQIAEAVRPKKEDEEATAAPTNIFLLSGCVGSTGHQEHVTVSHRMHIAGVTPKMSAANAAAYDNRKLAAGQAAGDDEAAASGGGAAAADGGEGAADGQDGSTKPQRLVIIPDTSVRVASNIEFIGVRPTVTVAPAIVEVKAAAPTKGKKQSEEDKAREAEEKRLREEAAIRAAKEEEARLNQFAMPHRWASVRVENITFEGHVSIKQAHITFVNCTFVHAAVEVTPYAKVQFQRCVFSEPAKNALYLFPLSEVTLKDCVFTGLAPSTSAQEAEQAFQTTQLSANHHNNVGIHTDGAKLLAEGCGFEHLGTGVLLRGKYQAPAAPAAAAASEGAPEGEAAASSSKKPNPSSQVVKGCTFDRIYSTGILCDHASGVSLFKNTVLKAEYYGVRLVNGGKQTVIGNRFVSKVLVGRGCRPTLHSNAMDLPLKDENDVGCVYMEPTYGS